MKPRDLTNQRFGRLVVLSRVHRGDKRNSYWLCRCDCGKTTEVSRCSLIQGHTTSCGCWKREHSGYCNKRHGLTDTVEHNTWMRIRARCENIDHPKYPIYGARGISVCKRWQIFENFLADMGKRPEGYTSIDRKENDGNYEPGNCRWSTAPEQCRNRRDSVLLTYKGETLNYIDWARRLGVSHTTLRHRFNKGWSVEKTFETPFKGRPGFWSGNHTECVECHRSDRKHQGFGLCWHCYGQKRYHGLLPNPRK